MVKLGIVVPCYNEEEVLPDTVVKLSELMTGLMEKGKLTTDSFLLFVDDGSRDATWELIEKYHRENKLVDGLKLAGNVGHQNALLGGLMSVKDELDAAISIDADLQDDISVIEEMVDLFTDGVDIVFGVRQGRQTDSFFKRFTAQSFYKLMQGMGVKSVYNHADFRLMSKRALEGLSEYKERNLFLRGIVPTIGYRSECVYYDRKERLAGESKYPFGKMLSFAIDGITSFSIKPMTMIMYTGLGMIFFAVLAAAYSLYRYLTNDVVRGWTTMILSIWFIGGILTFSVGLVGVYIGKIYLEVKERPRYIVETRLSKADEYAV